MFCFLILYNFHVLWARGFRGSAEGLVEGLGFKVEGLGIHSYTPDILYLYITPIASPSKKP